MPSPTVENYLKALLALSRDSGEVNVTDLSAALGVSKPAANGMVKTLAAQHLVSYERYKPLVLTEEGRRAAALIIRKHRLTEMYLVDQMGFGWEEVHEIAEQMEHIQSPRFFARMDEIMGFPTADPHGSPIPDREGAIARPDYRMLAEAVAGETVVLKAVSSQADELLSFLNRKGIGLGTEITILEIESFDGSLTVGLGEGRVEMLTKEVGRSLLVG